jgi:hypothetical protein
VGVFAYPPKKVHDTKLSGMETEYQQQHRLFRCGSPVYTLSQHLMGRACLPVGLESGRIPAFSPHLWRSDSA